MVPGEKGTRIDIWKEPVGRKARNFSSSRTSRPGISTSSFRGWSPYKQAIEGCDAVQWCFWISALFQILFISSRAPFSLINWLSYYQGPVLSLGHKKSQWLPAGAIPRTVSTACQPAANVCTLSSSHPSPPPFAFTGALGKGLVGKLPLEVWQQPEASGSALPSLFLLPQFVELMPGPSSLLCVEC